MCQVLSAQLILKNEIIIKNKVSPLDPLVGNGGTISFHRLNKIITIKNGPEWLSNLENMHVCF